MTGRPSFTTLYGLPVLYVTASIMTLLAFAARPEKSATDFLTFYQSGRQFLAGGDPYFPYVAARGPNLNPPLVVGLMAQLCRAPYLTAIVGWWALSFACLLATSVLTARVAAPGQAGAIAAAVLVTQAAFANIRLGQVAWPLMLLVTAAWRADRAGRSAAAGALLGLAASWKPFLFIFVPYLVWRRAWRSLAAMTASVACVALAGLLVTGAAAYASWVATLKLVAWEGHPLNASVRGLITRMLTPSSLADLYSTPIVVAPAWRDVVWIGAVLLLLAIAAWRLAATRNLDVAWATLGLIAVLVSPLGWLHYVPLVTGPLVAALLVGRAAGRQVGVAGWLLLCVPFLWIKSSAFGVLGTVTVASSYGLGTLMLLAAVWLSDAPHRPKAKGEDDAGSTMPAPIQPLAP